MKKKLILLLAAVGLAVSCSDDDKQMPDQPAEVRVTNVDLSAFVSGRQTVTDLDNGVYTLEYYGRTSGSGYVEANGRRSAPVAVTTTQAKGSVRGVKVTDGTCTIEVSGEDVSSFTVMKLVEEKSRSTRALVKGGDISELSLVEQKGGKYYNEDGEETECLEYLSSNGMNTVRLRLYNEPGKYKYAGSDGTEYELPEGIQDEADILGLALRAKQKGMQIVLSIYYSDFWADASIQYIPHAWKDMSASQMKSALYAYTYAFMEKMKAQGTVPEYVSLGNETQNGMLFPLGGPLDSSLDDYNTRVQNLCDFYNTGYAAVKASSPATKVIIHLANAGDKGNYNWYFGLMHEYDVNYDIIGASYYPFWTNRTAKEVCEWAEYVTEKFDKDLIFMETGYAWSATIDDGVTNGQLTNNLPYTDLSQRGQKNFMLELTNEINKTESGRILGYLYWDPIFIPAGDAGWVVGQPNVVSNSALFGFDGKALEVFDAFRWNN